jgi:Peroxidase, family 2
MFMDAIRLHTGIGVDVAAILAARPLEIPVDQERLLADEGVSHFEHGGKQTQNASWLSASRMKDVDGQSGVRPVDQRTVSGDPYISLSDLLLHGAVEHDVSATRLDASEGDYRSVQPHLVDMLLNTSSDGVFINKADAADFRAKRLETQRQANPQLVFGEREAFIAYGEMALLMSVFGDFSNDHRVKCGYVKTFFLEEKFPVDQGWQKRTVPIGLTELAILIKQIQELAEKS